MSRALIRGLAVAVCIALAMPAHAQSVNAVAESGTADAGIASRPISTVTANDTVGGAAATLGMSGNATVAQVGTWPRGVTFIPSTGAILTAPAVRPGTYQVQYQLCDKNSPPDCARATDTVTVIAASIAAVPDSGSADAGIASRAILNVAANDTVNGAPATLGVSGNAMVAKLGIWPTGIALNTSSGAIITAVTVPVGTYSPQYKLCDRNLPPSCASATDTVTVIAASIVALPETDSVVAGIASKLIANVAANDTVDGAAATLGASGNATVAQVGTWPDGITLNSTTGAVSDTAVVPAGTYSIRYRLCDKNSPADCAVTTDTVTLMAATFTEVQVSTGNFGDIEFDWGRDGVYCATCNFGEGNARFNWTDPFGNLWVGHLDPNTGAFTPTTGDNELADTTAFNYAVVDNGPEWASSTQDGQVVSQLVYARYPPGTQPVAANAGAAFATQVSGGWTASFFPGAIGATGSGGTINTVMPAATQCNSFPTAITEFIDLSSPQTVYWEPTTTAPGTAPTPTPIATYASAISGGKPAIRWVACTHQMVIIGAAPPDDTGTVYQQVYWYDTDTQVSQQLTFDPTEHAGAYIFQAPEFNGAFVLYTVINDVEIDIYKQTGTGSNGAPTFQLVNQIRSPDPAEPFIHGSEPFINCAPTCQSYIFMKLQSTISNASNINYAASGVAVTNINPAQPVFKILIQQLATPTVQQNDLEYYITPNGPYLYYQRNTIQSATTQFQYQGRFFIDMQLGAPSGPCVGSSAEGGMLPGC